MKAIVVNRSMLESLMEFKEMLQGEQLPPLNETEGGREILSLIESIGEDMCKEFTVSAKLMGPKSYLARTFSFTNEEIKGKKAWRARLLEPAMPELFNGEPDNLREVMISMAKAHDVSSVSVWVSPIVIKGKTIFFMFVRHSSGVETSYIADDGRWHEGPPIAEVTEMTLRSLLRVSDGTREKWASILSKSYQNVEESLRKEFSEILDESKIPNLPDEVWQKITLAFVANTESIQAVQAASRYFGTPIIQSTQNHMDALIQVIDQAEAYYQQKLAQLEKDQQRALTRFKSDLKKYKAAQEISAKRAQLLGRELAEARRQNRESTLSSGAGTTSMGLALDELFSK